MDWRCQIRQMRFVMLSATTIFFVLILSFGLHRDIVPFDVRVFAHDLPELPQCASHCGFAFDKAIGCAFKVVEEIGSK